MNIVIKLKKGKNSLIHFLLRGMTKVRFGKTVFDKDDLENLQRLVAKGAVDMAPLILDVVPVSEAKLIYDRLRDQPQELLGTVFDWR